MSFGYLEASRVGDADMSNCWKNKDFSAFEGANRESFEKRIQETYQKIIDTCNNHDVILIVSHREIFLLHAGSMVWTRS